MAASSKGYPTFPAATAFLPEHENIVATNLVTVVFPLVPVIAIKPCLTPVIVHRVEYLPSELYFAQYLCAAEGRGNGRMSDRHARAGDDEVGRPGQLGGPLRPPGSLYRSPLTLLGGSPPSRSSSSTTTS